MIHNTFSEEIINAIRETLKQVKAENNIENNIPKEDIFSLLDRFCTVLYYPLEDKDINGIHVQRMVGEESEHFVYINTENTLEKQIYTAAHELGHIWKIDERIAKDAATEQHTPDDIINRFAAELLMPTDSFKRILTEKIAELGYDGDKISISRDNLFRSIVYSMNEFMVPYKAVVLRMEELHLISDKVIQYLDSFEEAHRDTIDSFIAEGQYEKLNRSTKRKSMKNLVGLVNKAEELSLYNQRKIGNIRKTFDINEQDTVDILDKYSTESFDILL